MLFSAGYIGQSQVSVTLAKRSVLGREEGVLGLKKTRLGKKLEGGGRNWRSERI